MLFFDLFSLALFDMRAIRSRPADTIPFPVFRVLSQPAWVQVIDLISLKPFDMEAITRSVRKTRRVIIVEECMKTGGIGASLSASINEALFDELDHQVCFLKLSSMALAMSSQSTAMPASRTGGSSANQA